MPPQSVLWVCPEIVSPGADVDRRPRVPLVDRAVPAGSAPPGSGNAERQPVIYWRPVACAGGIASLLVAGLIVGVSMFGPSGPAGKASERGRPLTLPALERLLATSQQIPAREANGPTKPEAAADKSTAPVAEPGNEVKRPAPGPDANKPAAALAGKPTAGPATAATSDDPVAKRSSLPASEQPLDETPRAAETYGTKVAFVSNPPDAAQQALKERKLLFVLHLSGNFEDEKFT
jgi:hypothetical protein